MTPTHTNKKGVQQHGAPARLHRRVVRRHMRNALERRCGRNGPRTRNRYRELSLIAIAKARKWIKDAERGHSFAAIARREGKAERHIRHLVVLAFVSPRIITAIMDGTASAELTVTALASRLPYSWAEQEQLISMRQ
jgi:hypothetical protein